MTPAQEPPPLPFEITVGVLGCYAFWDYLGSRLSVPDESLIPPLSELVRCRGQPA
jgi:hypothetical protein